MKQKQYGVIMTGGREENFRMSVQEGRDPPNKRSQPPEGRKVSSQRKVPEAKSSSACSRNGQSLLWLEHGAPGQVELCCRGVLGGH